MNPFGSLSREALVAVQIGSAEARALKHHYLGVEHVVIGLCKIADPDLHQAMEDAAFDRRFFRRHLRNALGTGQDHEWGSQTIVTPRFSSVVRLAGQIAQYWNLREVRPGHLFLAVLLENGSMPMRALAGLGWDIEPLKLKIFEMLGGASGSPARSAAQPAGTPSLNAMGRDLSALAREGRLQPVIGRKAEILAVTQTLARQTKSNVLLIGEPGVGKTCIVEALAQRSVRKDAPAPLSGKRIVEITMGSLLAGTQFRGDFEKRVESILQEARSHPEVILFLDEIHTLVGAGTGGSGGMDAANMFKPALGRGEICCIGATTIDEYHRYFEKDAALERRFEVIHVGEPSRAETVRILAGIKESLEAHHGVSIQSEAIEEAVKLAERYITDRHFPDKAVDLLDRACSEVRLQSLTVKDGQFQAGPVNREMIARVVSLRTGIPVGSLTAEDAQVLLHLDETLRRRVVGQDEAISILTQAIISRRQFDNPRRPKGVFLFLGPTGVGKTELAKVLASVLFGSENQLIRFDMSEYMERHAAMRLIGAPPSYVGHEEEGQLTGAVRRRPYSLLLFDEVEKAHPDVMNVFLQLFDDGRLTDGKGRTVDFTSTLIIMTSNLGSDACEGGAPLGFRTFDASDTGGHNRQSHLAAVHKAVKQAFRPEFINRIDEMIVFNPISRASLGALLDLLLEELQGQVSEKGLRLEADNDVRELLIEQGFSEAYGARELRRAVDRLVRRPLAAFLLKESPPAGTAIRAFRRGLKVEFEGERTVLHGGTM